MIADDVFDRVSQTAHVCSGALAVLICFTIWGADSETPSAALTLIAAAIKEFWYDENYEGIEERGSNTRDFLFYLLGVILALTLCRAVD